jgi:glycosyltransferase involved in cell wall biosynthesis
MHALQPARPARNAPTTRARVANAVRRVPAGLARLAHGVRYWRAGLADLVHEIAPDVLHGHYVVEHGFYGALLRFRPYVVTAWGSDVLVAPEKDPFTKQIARWTLGRADAATSNNVHMGRRMLALGAPRKRLHLVVLGADKFFSDLWQQSVNVEGHTEGGSVILSTRAHEPLYNIGEIVQAVDLARKDSPDARLILAHRGSLTEDLRAQTAQAGNRVHFTGTVPRERLRELMRDAHVFVSVPSSDGTSVALLQAMSAGAFPIVADLPTQREWIEDGVNGRRVPVHNPRALADAITAALGDAPLRHNAAEINRAIVSERGTNETQMLKMEAIYRSLARDRRAVP